MSVIKLYGKGKITTGRTEIKVPYKDEVITFIYPANGPNTYQGVMQQIIKEGLLRPTTAQTLSLVNLALRNPDEEHCEDILTKLEKHNVVTSIENLCTPEGVFVYNNYDGTISNDENELYKKFNEKDSTVRFVPHGFKTGELSISDFIKNPYIIAQVGQGSEELVAKTASKFRQKPYLLSFGKFDKPIKKYTTIGSGRDHVGLCISNISNNDFGCYAFGVVPVPRNI